MKQINNISFGLFNARGRYFYRNVKDIKILIKRILFTLKHGYPPQATWETFDWFTHVMKDILTEYNKNRWGYPFGTTSEEWGKEIEHAIALLEDMDENNPKYDNMPYGESNLSQINAKNEFMDWFKEHFFDLWD